MDNLQENTLPGRLVPPVTVEALVARINRALKHEDMKIRKCREASRDHHNLGDYFVVNISDGFVIQEDVSLEELARKWEVLKPWEKMEA